MPQMDRRQVVVAAISATLGAALTQEGEVRAEGQSAEKIFAEESSSPWPTASPKLRRLP